MLTHNAFQHSFSYGVHFLDGATGSNLLWAGMPPKCNTETWVLEQPDVLIRLQSEYAAAGCEILYAPTFQA